MWSLSDIRTSLLRALPASSTHASAAPTSNRLNLDFDELIAMQGQGRSFGRSQKVDGLRLGEQASRKRGIGLELESIGPYQWGDDIRHMDWFATARTGRPQIKQFRRDVQQTLILVIDLRPSMLFGSTRQLMAKTACLAAAKIAWSTSKDHQPLGLMLVGHRSVEFVPPRRGRRARLQRLAQIVDAYRQATKHVGEATEPLGMMLEDLPSRMAGDIEAVIISDFSHLGDDFERCLREASARGEQSAVVIEDGLMQGPPPAGLYPFRRRQGGQTVTIAIRRHDANVYQEEAERHRRRLVADLMGLGMRQVLFSDAQSINEGYFR
jgi:uncharacterized protein (DUF58 family)